MGCRFVVSLSKSKRKLVCLTTAIIFFFFSLLLPFLKSPAHDRKEKLESCAVIQKSGINSYYGPSFSFPVHVHGEYGEQGYVSSEKCNPELGHDHIYVRNAGSIPDFVWHIQIILKIK